MSVADIGFILAVGALGWGLSLVTYRAFATRQGWPMGTWHTRAPRLPIAIGAVCMVLAAWVATRRIGDGDDTSGWLILLFGLGWAVFWTGFSSCWRAKRPAARACCGPVAVAARPGLAGAVAALFCPL